MCGRPAPWTGPFQDLLGYTAHIEPNGDVRLEPEVTERHTSQYGIAHGGVTLTLLDAAGGLAALVAAGDPVRIATISLAAGFVRPVSHGRVVARGRVRHLGGAIAHTRMELFAEDGILLAEGQGSYRLFRRRGREGAVPLP